MSHVPTECPICHVSFDCNPQGRCWCLDLPHGPMPATEKGCLCPDCLAKRSFHPLKEYPRPGQQPGEAAGKDTT
jgi:hypothetical protein